MQGKHDYGRFDFVGKIGVFGGVSLALVVAALVYLAVHGITYGIDFVGGTEMQVKFGSGKVNIEQVRAIADKQGLLNVGLQSFGDKDEFIIRFQTVHGKTDKETNEIQNKAVVDLKEAINTQMKDSQPDIRRVDSVGPQVGAELKRDGLLAVFYCLLVIWSYVALRFDYKLA